ncbi:MAG: hypothetical protein AAFR21_17435 [Pseudomonadota bacterium]
MDQIDLNMVFGFLAIAGVAYLLSGASTPTTSETLASAEEKIGRLDPAAREQVLAALQDKKKILAIKVFRGATAATLREAKVAVEKMARDLKYASTPIT